MKGRRPLEFSFPAEFLPMLGRYLAFYRPYLLALRESRGQSRQRHPSAGPASSLGDAVRHPLRCQTPRLRR